MAAPNITNLTAIYGKSAVQAVGTSATAIVTNSAASGKVIKVNGLTVANVDGANTCDVTVDLYRSSTAYRLAYLMTVPAKSTLVVIGKDAGLYLEEGDSLRLTASAAGDLEAVAIYEELA
jgi:hypothetical protein